MAGERLVEVHDAILLVEPRFPLHGRVVNEHDIEAAYVRGEPKAQQRIELFSPRKTEATMPEPTLAARVKKVMETHEVSGDVMSRIAKIHPSRFSQMLHGKAPIDAASRSRLENAVLLIETLAESARPVPPDFHHWRLIGPLVAEYQRKFHSRRPNAAD